MNEIEQLKQRIVELEAQVMRLFDVGSDLRYHLMLNRGFYDRDAGFSLVAWDEEVEKTPAQCLAEIKAQAVEDEAKL